MILFAKNALFYWNKFNCKDKLKQPPQSWVFTQQVKEKLKIEETEHNNQILVASSKTQEAIWQKDAC